MIFENISNNLRDGYKQLVPGIRHADELMHERVKNQENQELRDLSFYTADGVIYFLEGRTRTPTLAITREPNNLVLRHIDDAYDQLRKNGNYRLNSEEVRSAIKAQGTVVIDLTKLALQRDKNSKMMYDLAIPAHDYNSLSKDKEEKNLVQRVFGQEKDITAALQMLADTRWRTTELKIVVLSPDYVRAEAREGPIGLVSWLGGLHGGFAFSTNCRAIDGGLSCLRGVRKKSSNDLISAQKVYTFVGNHSY